MLSKNDLSQRQKPTNQKLDKSCNRVKGSERHDKGTSSRLVVLIQLHELPTSEYHLHDNINSLIVDMVKYEKKVCKAKNSKYSKIASYTQSTRIHRSIDL